MNVNLKATTFKHLCSINLPSVFRLTHPERRKNNIRQSAFEDSLLCTVFGFVAYAIAYTIAQSQSHSCNGQSATFRIPPIIRRRMSPLLGGSHTCRQGWIFLK